MTPSVILDVVIGVCFIYMMCAVFCSAFVEFLAGALNWRATQLEAGIRKLLAEDPTVGDGPRPIADKVLARRLFAQVKEEPAVKVATPAPAR